MRKALLSAVLLCMGLAAMAQSLRVPGIFSDGMVLQRNSTAKIWGWAEPGSTVKVYSSWADPAETICGEDGKWSVGIATGEASWGNTLSIISGAEAIDLKGVMLGEVWICSGQSNMQFAVGKSLDVDPDDSNKKIRLFNSGRISAAEPQEDIPGVKWVGTGRKTLAGFSAVAYAFGQKLQKELNVPIGLMLLSYGGTTMETWLPKEIVENSEKFSRSHEERAKAVIAKEKDGKLPLKEEVAAQWNANIAPVLGYTVAGVIWYQGESNVGTASCDFYDAELASFINCMRRGFGNPRLPFYLAQIAPHTYSNCRGARLRECQAKVANSLPFVEMICTIDQTDVCGDIHPRNKKAVGERFADVALGTHYGKAIDYKMIQYKSMEPAADGSVKLNFSYAEKGFAPLEGRIEGFYAAGADGVYRHAEAVISGENIFVSCNEMVGAIANVRYCFDETWGRVHGNNGLPLAPFRTDKDNRARMPFPIITPPAKLEVRGKELQKDIMSDETILWSNRPYSCKAFPASMMKCQYVLPVITRDPNPDMWITSPTGGRVYALIFNYLLPTKLEDGWKLLPNSQFYYKNYTKKNGRSGYGYIMYRDFAKGETAHIESMANTGHIIPFAKKLKYKTK